MDEFKKRFSQNFADMERQMGRMMRNMSFPRMFPFQSGTSWYPPADIYETDDLILVYVDVAGINPDKMTVNAEPTSVTIAGERLFSTEQNICRIHQLEIEHGYFERTLPLPVPVDVNSTSSSCQNGFLIIELPKQRLKGKIQVKIG
ncbi:MAG: Hsp20/alpha crystallin family protein [Desulfobulbaceae bacterium]|nr:Hsp20/alpha crystallin family protein [Desulfobulbaceae bacterium]